MTWESLRYHLGVPGLFASILEEAYKCSNISESIFSGRKIFSSITAPKNPILGRYLKPSPDSILMNRQEK